MIRRLAASGMGRALLASFALGQSDRVRDRLLTPTFVESLIPLFSSMAESHGVARLGDQPFAASGTVIEASGAKG